MIKGKGAAKSIKPPQFHGSMTAEEKVQLSTKIRRDTDAMIGKLVDHDGGDRPAVVERAIRELFRQKGLQLEEGDIENFSKRNAR